MWRSLVAHLTGGQGVAGSNPVIPTNKGRGQLHIAVGPLFLSGTLWPVCGHSASAEHGKDTSL